MNGYRHSSGDTEGTCDACALETFGYDRPEETLCTDPRPEGDTGDASTWCATCGHNVEPDPMDTTRYGCVYWGAFDNLDSAEPAMRALIETWDRPGTVWRVEVSPEPTRAHPHGIRHLYAWVPRNG